MGHEDVEVLSRHGTCKVVTLTGVAVEGALRMSLANRLHAFGDDAQAKGMGEVDDGAHDGRACLVPPEGVDQTLVDQVR